MLTLYTASPHSDKAAVYLEESAGIRLAEPERKIIMIVPDQFSYYAEKRFAERFGGTGINGIEVMTFRQMTRRFLFGGRGKKLSAEGKRMLVKKAIKNSCGEESVFFSCIKKQGFSESIASLISEWKRYGIPPSELEQRSKENISGALSEKLDSLTEIYKTYNRYFTEGRFLDSDDDIAKTAAVIPSCGYFDSAFVWFDEFSDFLPQHYAVIKALLSCGCDVNIFTDGEASEERDIFSVSGSARMRLAETAASLGIMCRKIPVLRRRKISPEIEFLSEHYDDPEAVYPKSSPNIHIFQGQDSYSETRHAAEEILDLIRGEGFRRSDIAVLCGDPDNYIHFIEPIFEEYHIPYFSDYKMPVSDHPAAMAIVSLFDIIRLNKAYRPMFTYLRTGLIDPEGIPENSIDLLENHVLKRGIRGSMWNDEKYWQDTDERIFDSVLGEYKTKYKSSSGAPENADSFLNEIRKRVTEPIDRFIAETKGKKTVTQMSKALFSFCGDIKLYESISEKISHLKHTDPNAAAQFERVWVLFCEVLDQAAASMGGDLCTVGEFGEFICEGLSCCEIRIIPTGLDRVSVGDAARAALTDIKALFILGMNNGVVPKIHDSEGLLSDSERGELTALGTELAPDTKTQTLLSEFKLYKALCAPCERLYLSFPTTQKDGSLLQPSRVLQDISAMFPSCIRSNDLSAAKKHMFYISSPEATMHRLLSLLGSGGELPPLWRAVSRWYRGQGEKWIPMLKTADIAGAFRALHPSLSPELAAQLYKGRNNYSVSRLETYYKCPFRYFLENGLRARERDEYKVKSSDIGDVIHWAVREYCIRVDGGAATAAQKKQNWDALTREKSLMIIADIMDTAQERLGFLPYSPNKQRILLSRIRSVLEKSIRTVNRSFQKGSYTSAGFEWRFDDFPVDPGSSVTLHGVIDRIDVHNDTEAGRAYIRIIDYKSGAKAFRVSDICNKLDLQLVVYAMAAVHGYRSGALDCECLKLEPVISGLFYDKLNNKYVSCSLDELDKLESKLGEKAYLDGMVYYDDSSGGIDELLAYDKDLDSQSESSYVKIVLKKDKTPHKSRSRVGNELDIAALTDLAKKAVTEADSRIKEGCIDVLPYRHSSSQTAATACSAYCPYQDICSFDREKECKFRMLKPGNKALFETVNEYLAQRSEADETMDR